LCPVTTQPWDFVLVTDREQLTELAMVWQGARHVAGAAAAIAIVAPEPQDDRQAALLQYDLGQTTFAMTVAAGHGGGDAARETQGYAGSLGSRVRDRHLNRALSTARSTGRPVR
jgi:nitroreductase